MKISLIAGSLLVAGT